MASKQAKAREFSTKARKQINLRDNNMCIFCQAEYKMQGATWMGLSLKSIMHYIPRSHNGLGIPENGAVGCQYHHEMLDNGNGGNREEMLQMFRDYLKSYYPNWNEEKLVYKKYDF